MSIPKLKSLVIAVLLLINLFFLADIITNRVSDSAQRNRTIESLQAVMSGADIIFSDNAVGDITALDPYVTSQDAFAEAVIARAILGECEPLQSESGRQYTGSRGTAIFFNTRGFEIELTESFSPSGTTTSRAAKKLLKSMGIETSEPVSRVLGDTEYLTSICTWRGAQIFNCTVTFEFSDDVLLRVYGIKPSGITEAPESGSVGFSTALLSFLRYEQSQELGVSVITSIDSGYRMNVGAFGNGTLTPGWLITTDAGDFFADATTGEVLRNDT